MDLKKSSFWLLVALMVLVCSVIFGAAFMVWPTATGFALAFTTVFMTLGAIMVALSKAASKVASATTATAKAMWQVTGVLGRLLIVAGVGCLLLMTLSAIYDVPYHFLKAVVTNPLSFWRIWTPDKMGPNYVGQLLIILTSLLFAAWMTLPGKEGRMRVRLMPICLLGLVCMGPLFSKFWGSPQAEQVKQVLEDIGTAAKEVAESKAQTAKLEAETAATEATEQAEADKYNREQDAKLGRSLAEIRGATTRAGELTKARLQMRDDKARLTIGQAVSGMPHLLRVRERIPAYKNLPDPTFRQLHRWLEPEEVLYAYITSMVEDMPVPLVKVRNATRSEKPGRNPDEVFWIRLDDLLKIVPPKLAEDLWGFLDPSQLPQELKALKDKLLQERTSAAAPSPPSPSAVRTVAYNPTIFWEGEVTTKISAGSRLLTPTGIAAYQGEELEIYPVPATLENARKLEVQNGSGPIMSCSLHVSRRGSEWFIWIISPSPNVKHEEYCVGTTDGVVRVRVYKTKAQPPVPAGSV